MKIDIFAPIVLNTNSLSDIGFGGVSGGITPNNPTLNSSSGGGPIGKSHKSINTSSWGGLYTDYGVFADVTNNGNVIWGQLFTSD